MGRRIVELLVQGLRQIGVPYAFGVPGRAVMPVYNAFFDSGFPECVLATHETAAAFMAAAWATLRGVPGLVLGTTGPGATNMATGLATAFTEGIPLLALTGEVPSSEFARRAYQESSGIGRSVDTVALLSTVTKRSGKAVSAPHLAELLATWIPVARAARPGPVHVSVPWDLWEQEIPEALFDDCLRSMTQPPTPTPPAASDLDAVVAALCRAERPLLLTGRGLAMGGAGEAATACARRWMLPWVTSARGKGAVAHIEGLSLGHLGPAGGVEVVAALATWRPDLMLCVGTSLGPLALGGLPRSVDRPHTILQVNIDPEDRGALWKCDRFILADAGAFFEALAHHAPSEPPQRSGMPFCIPSTCERVLDSELADGLHPAAVWEVIREHLPDDAIVVPDSGNHWLWTMRMFRNCHTNGLLPGRSLGAMGQGTAGAIGASLAEPSRPVVAITGDGSFLMHGAEVITAVARHARVLWIVFNDGALGRIWSAQVHDFGGRVHSTLFPPIDFAVLATGYGLWGCRVDRLASLGSAIREGLATSGPALLDVRISRSVPPP